MEKSKLRKDLKIYSLFYKIKFFSQRCQIIGDVELKKYASVWYNCVLRADINKLLLEKGPIFRIIAQFI